MTGYCISSNLSSDPVHDLLPELVIVTNLFQLVYPVFYMHWTLVHCDWILFLELDPGYSPFTYIHEEYHWMYHYYFIPNMLERVLFVCKNPYFIYNMLERVVFVCKNFHFTSNILERVLFVFH